MTRQSRGSLRELKTTWMALPHGIVSDPVWLAIANEADSTPAVACMLWLQSRDFVSRSRWRGWCLGGFKPDDTAVFCGVDGDETLRVGRILADRGMLDHFPQLKTSFIDWADSARDDGNVVEFPGTPPPISATKSAPSAGALRQRRYRARQKAKAAAATEQQSDAAHGADRDACDIVSDMVSTATDVTSDARGVTGDACDMVSTATDVTGDARGVTGDASGYPPPGTPLLEPEFDPPWGPPRDRGDAPPLVCNFAGYQEPVGELLDAGPNARRYRRHRERRRSPHQTLFDVSRLVGAARKRQMALSGEQAGEADDRTTEKPVDSHDRFLPMAADRISSGFDQNFRPGRGRPSGGGRAASNERLLAAWRSPGTGDGYTNTWVSVAALVHGLPRLATGEKSA